jgi:coenzyme F420-0:L-glutamate ligase/coenzyme F420-1:gamma-L-glutamate ligase
MSELRALPLRGMGEIKPGDSLAEAILAALRRRKLRLRAGDILAVTHKVVSKAEGQVVRLDAVQPSARAARWARRAGHDARVVELALRESQRVVRRGHGVLITETRHGFTCANSGVDLSNVDGGASAALLPRDPDRSAARLHRALKRRLGLSIPVLITDTFGRPWRLGLSEAAIGLAGMKPFRDYRGRRDPYGYCLHASLEAVADELAALAGLACGKLDRTPVCLIRGFRYQPGRGHGRDLLRARREDLFR